MEVWIFHPHGLWYFSHTRRSLLQRLHWRYWCVKAKSKSHAQLLTHASEDAPAPMALRTFSTEVKDGKIWVTATPSDTLKANMARQPKLLATGVNATGKGVVIIGGGSGTFHAVESLREVL